MALQSSSSHACSRLCLSIILVPTCCPTMLVNRVSIWSLRLARPTVSSFYTSVSVPQKATKGTQKRSVVPLTPSTNGPNSAKKGQSPPNEAVVDRVSARALATCQVYCRIVIPKHRRAGWCQKGSVAAEALFGTGHPQQPVACTCRQQLARFRILIGTVNCKHQA